MQVLSHMTAQMEQYVLRCFNSAPVDEEEVDVLIERTKRQPGSKSKDARQGLRKIYVEMVKAALSSPAKGSRGAGYAVRQCMDAAFAQHLGAQSRVEYMFANQRSNRWKHELVAYFDQVIAELPTVIASIPRTNEPVDKDEREELESLQWCVAKVKVLKYIIAVSKTEKTLCAVPFMTRSVYSHMVKLLDMIEESLKEVR